MAVCRLVDGIKARGGVVTHLESACGGLPAPAAADNPLGYKWTWSPRGALLAMDNGARWLERGAERAIAPGGGRLLAAARPARLAGLPAYALERLPNRDALPYAEKYGVAGARLEALARGTLRYAGFAQRMGLLAAAGLCSAAPRPMPEGLRQEGSAPFAVPLLALLAGCAGLREPRGAAPRAVAEALLAALARAGADAGGAEPSTPSCQPSPPTQAWRSPRAPQTSRSCSTRCARPSPTAAPSGTAAHWRSTARAPRAARAPWR